MFRNIILGLLLVAAPGYGAASTPDIGRTVAVKNEVTLESGANKKPLTLGSDVHQDEVIITAADSSAQIELLDRTKFAVGPEARIVLDKFIYDASASRGTISINLAQGAFRFITGVAQKEAYEIKTPTASLGVRGTVFDVYVAENGETAVLLHRGAVEICNLARSCQLHNKPRQIVFIGLDGEISQHTRWDGTFMPGVGAATAFPFVGVSLAIDPVVRMSLNELVNGQGSNTPANPNPGQPANSNPGQNVRQAGRQPSNTGNAGATPGNGQGTQQGTPQGETVADVPPAAIGGLAIVGGMVYGIEKITNQPASP